MPKASRRWILFLTIFALGVFNRPILAQTPSQGLLREVYAGIGGNTIADLTNNPAFPNNPTSTNYVTDYFESPTNVMEEYGQRMRGFIIPPATGDYTFWIATDDGGSLYLSTDSDPVNKRPIAYVSSWTAVREWGKEANQQSAPIRLEEGQSYYIEALQKEGGGGDNLAVRWRLPNGTIEEPIPASRLRPWGITMTPPIITQQPTNTTAVEGEAASFSVRVSNVDTLFYQWQRNNANIPGANSRVHTINPVALADDGSIYRCFLSNKLGTAFSDTAALRVTPDITPPALVSARNVSDRAIELVFSEALDATTATRAANYQVSGGLTVSAAAFGANTKVVILTLSSPMTFQTEYTVTVSGVKDRAATPNTIATGSPISFVAFEYVPFEVGATSAPAQVDIVSGGFNVTAFGSEIGGSSDQFHFDYQSRTGNFDIKVRLENLTGADMWSKAGLMARETLTANSVFAATLATPSLAGAFFQYRQTTGAGAAQTGFAPVNYPNTWLRLARAANTFTSYASVDGSNWVRLGSVSITMPSTIYVGTALASRSSTKAAKAAFRDIGVVSGGTIVASLPTKGEPLAPSSRRTGLVVSEIMYHPADRADGKDLEYIELFNADPVAEDLSGFRFAGPIDYTFPNGTILSSGNFLVVAKDPAAVRAVYGIDNVIGGYLDNLSNDSGVIRVHSATALLLEAHYSDKMGWPIAADGAGHSLALARPSYGEAIREAWSASALKGGSPGRAEPIRSDLFENLVINEILAHTDEPLKDYIEIYNHSNVAVKLDGCFLSDSKDSNRFQFPANTTIGARGFLAVDQDAVGFRLDSGGETLFLVASNNVRVIDAIRFEGQANGVGYGRYPDGASKLTALKTITQGAANDLPLVRDVVINEIMYHSITESDDDEYVELFNRGANSVDLSGWKFTDGVDYTFPSGATLSAGGYLVVAKNLANLRLKYSHLNGTNSFGDYDGTLSNSGERLALSMPDQVLVTNEFDQVTTEIIHIVVSEVEFREGGRWGTWADGGGSSLELIDPRADLSQPSSWADSNEESKSVWTTIEFTGTLDNGAMSSPDQFQMHLQGGGECLVDDVEVRGSSGGNRIVNAGFESDLANWDAQGAFDKSFVEAGAGISGSKALHVISPVRGDTGANRIRQNLGSPLSAGATGTLRAKVRWLKGHPEFLLRLRGSWLEAYGKMNLPAALGTPSLPNSRSRSNLGPSIYEVAHTPVLPAANTPVVVTARVTDPDGVNTPQLFYRVDPTATFTTVTMNDSGTGADAVVSDGIWSATIPGQTADKLAAFYVRATDRTAASTVATFPAEAPARECLVRWGETQSPGTLGTYRVWMSQSTVNMWASREVLNNAPLDVTFVYGNHRAVYNVGALYSGSPWHRGYDSPVGGACDYVLNFREDELFLGATDFVLNTVGNLGSDGAAQSEQAAFWIMRELGLPYNNRRFVHLFVNGQPRGSIFEDAQQPNSHFVEGWFPDDADGELMKIEDWFEFADNGHDFLGNVDAQLGFWTTTGGVLKPARYRWSWRPRAVKKSANDFTTFFELVRAANEPNAALYPTRLENVADMEEWMRVICVEHLVGNWDAYGYGRGKNMFMYRPSSGKWTLMAWDIDFVFNSGGHGPSTDMFGGMNDGAVGRMINDPNYGPRFRRAYYRAMLDAVNGPLAPGRIDPVVDSRYYALTANGVGVSDPGSIKQYIAARRSQLETLLSQVAVDFSITSNNGNNFSTNKNYITISGKAPIAVKTIEINGAAYPVTWTSVTNWSMNVPLPGKTNALNIAGFDLRGAAVAGSSDSITITYTGSVTSPKDIVVINEIMYNSLAANASYVELHNTSASTAYDLAGYRLDGVDFTFAEGSVIAPNGYLVVAKDAAAFSLAYGSGIPIAGVFTGSLDNGGERLTLLKPGATPDLDEMIDVVRYDDDPPWPVAADGTGPSLQLIDPARDNSRPGNWMVAVSGAAYTPGAVNNVKGTLPAFPTLWINEVLPNNTSNITDGAGEREPWVEIYNSGASAVDLSSLYLTDNYAEPLKWKFPIGASLGPLQFLVVWLDNEPLESLAGAPHATFRPNPTNGSIALTRQQGTSASVVDFINYNISSPNRSFGSYPDGQSFDRQLFHFVTPRETNDNRTLVIPVSVNEWMAGNTRTITDPADLRYDDWFELYNSGSEAIDLSGYYLTDNVTNWNQFRIPAGYFIPPQGHLLVWADSQSGQNVSTNVDLHTNFRLSSSGEQIGLFGADGTKIDSVTFGAQTDDVSEGRFPDGGASPYYLMPEPSPRGPNSIPSANQPPTLSGVSDAMIPELQEHAFRALATDPDPGQTLTFSLIGGPEGAAMDAVTGEFRWTPREDQGPGSYPMTVKVSDDGSPPLSRSQRLTLIVNEANLPPRSDQIPDLTVDEQTSIQFTIPASDPDLPAQPLFFYLDEGPAGAAVNANNGRFDWTPSELQGPGVFPVSIRIVDGGSPALSVTNQFTIIVRDANSRPHLDPINDQFVMEGDTLIVNPVASDTDFPAQSLTFSLSGLATAEFNTATGQLRWTPTASEIPSTNTVTIQVTDSGAPPLLTNRTFQVVAAKANRPPEYTPMPDQVIPEETPGSFQITVNDPDAGQILTFALEGSAPSGLTISSSGVVNWTPSEDQGPSTNTINFRVTDNGTPPQSVTGEVRIVVREVNRGPTVNPMSEQIATQDQPFAVTLAATDPDRPNNSFTWSLVNPPEGAAIDANTGRLTWTPSSRFAGAAHEISVRVTDNGSPAESGLGTLSIRVQPPTVWKFVSATGTASSSTIYIYLDGPGDVIIDDMRLVSGSTPAVGANLLPNGDFENVLTPWQVSANLTASHLTNIVKRGSTALHIVASAPGTTRASSIFQDITPALTANATYTLSYWYVPNTNNARLTVRLSGNGITLTTSIEAPEPPPAIDIAAALLVTGEIEFTWASRAGVNYRIYYRTDIETGLWQTLTDIAATGSTATFRTPTNLSQARFYKIVALP